jgi:hypothetical protein
MPAAIFRQLTVVEGSHAFRSNCQIDLGDGFTEQGIEKANASHLDIQPQRLHEKKHRIHSVRFTNFENSKRITTEQK